MSHIHALLEHLRWVDSLFMIACVVFVIVMAMGIFGRLGDREEHRAYEANLYVKKTIWNSGIALTLGCISVTCYLIFQNYKVVDPAYKYITTPISRTVGVEALNPYPLVDRRRGQSRAKGYSVQHGVVVRRGN